MKAIVLVAHGSRKSSSNEEVMRLGKALSMRLPDDISSVEVGFLELAKPSIPEAIESCIAKGATEVMVLPYFLSAGTHVVEDVPAEVKKVSDQHASVNIHLLKYVGGLDGMLDLMLSALPED